MNSYQITGVMAACITVFAGVVTLLALQGMPLMLAFLTVYLVALGTMLGMQRRARQCQCDDDAEIADGPLNRRALDPTEPAGASIGERSASSRAAGGAVTGARARIVC